MNLLIRHTAAFIRFSPVLLACGFFCFGISRMYAADGTDIKGKEKDLQRLKKEIDTYENKLRESEQKEKVTLDNIDTYEKQTNLIRSVLNHLTEEEERLRGEIGLTNDNIGAAEKQLTLLKEHYARYVTSVYKSGRVHDLETILSSRSINQLYIRITYLKRFSSQRQKDLRTIGERKQFLEEQRAMLSMSLQKERLVITDKQKERLALNSKTEIRMTALREIRRDKTTFQKELIRKTKAAESLSNLIVELIEKELIRKEREARMAREREREAERQRASALTESVEKFEPSVPFRQRLGKLPWPVSRGTVVAEFGNQVHPVLKTVTQNTGIEIAVPTGTPIRAVADAEVSMIHWLPSYGNLIILNHLDGYRTVYAHLTDITVLEGQKVREGNILAKSDVSVAGSLLHFELWKEKEKQDPEKWLTRRNR